MFTGTPDIHEIFCDISIRNPRASRYQPMAQRESGYCAETSAREKTERYPASGGRKCTPLMIETWDA